MFVAYESVYLSGSKFNGILKLNQLAEFEKRQLRYLLML